MENLKKKSKIYFIDLKNHLEMIILDSKKLTDILSSRYYVVFCVFVVMLIFGNISFATEEETDLLLDRFFEYCDNYYNVDFSGHYDIHSQYLQNHLKFIHYNKQQIKAKIYAYKNASDENLEIYSQFNSIGLMCWNTSFNLCLCYSPNNSNNDNYAYKQYQGNQRRTVVYYNQKHTNRIVVTVNNQGLISDAQYVDNGALNIQFTDLNTQGNNFSYGVTMYYEDNYYSSVPQWNGNTSYFVNDTNKRLNGQADYGFFNINYNDVQRIEVDEDIVFGDLYVGYNYSLNNQTIYLYNETTSQILDNEIDLIPISGLYNGRYHYQVVTEDLEGLNEDNQYRLICSSSSPLLSAFTSSKFRFYFNNEQPGQELPTLIILSGDYEGVGSGDGFNKAINDINNNLGVINGSMNKINNNIRNIGNYISDSSSPDSTLNNFFSGDYEDFAKKMGYSSLENNFYDYLKSTFQSIINAINVPIPNYDIHNKGQSITFEFHNQSFTLTTWDFNPFWIGYNFSNNPNSEVSEQHFQSLRIIISIFTNGFICYLIIKKFASWIVKIQTLDFNVVNSVDTDINLF